MSLEVAVACAVLSAVSYGAATAVQHRAAHTGSGKADARGLLRLLSDPRWLVSVLGDGIGLALQAVALSTGPVVLVQPLLVLAVPVSLPVGWALGGRRPSRGDYLACAGILLALGTFFVIVGDPGGAISLTPSSAGLVTLVGAGAGAVACALVRPASPTVRAAVYGAVAGTAFGIVGVLLDATSRTVQQLGWHALRAPSGWVPAVGLALVGALAVIITQVSFQVGPLGASFPANEVAAPVVAVVLGATVLHERVPGSATALTAYAACLLSVLAATIWLARAWSGPENRPGS
jgi:hypothetical protein